MRRLGSCLGLSAPICLLFCGGGGGPSATSVPAPAAAVWTRCASFPNAPVRGAVWFTVGSAAYVVSGMDYTSSPNRDCWKYDSITNAWTRKAGFPGTGVIEGAGFAIGQKGYVALGSTNAPGPGGMVADLWEFDPVANAWTRKPDLDGEARAMAVGFALGSELYFGLGNNNANANNPDLWRWRP